MWARALRVAAGTHDGDCPARTQALALRRAAVSSGKLEGPPKPDGTRRLTGDVALGAGELAGGPSRATPPEAGAALGAWHFVC